MNNLLNQLEALQAAAEARAVRNFTLGNNHAGQVFDLKAETYGEVIDLIKEQRISTTSEAAA